MRFQGKIRDWDDDRGFGFIVPLNGGERVFVHASAFPPRNRRPDDGEFVNYDLGADERGRARALNVTYIIAGSRRRDAQQSPSLATIVTCAAAITFVGGLAAAAFIEALPWWISVLYLLASIVTYGTYARDKDAAVREAQRTSEKTLLVFGLAGGWPGALFAQYHRRHKNRKVSFQIKFWFTVVLNLGLLIWARSWF